MSYSRSTTSAKDLEAETGEGGNNKWIRVRLVEEDGESLAMTTLGVTESKKLESLPGADTPLYGLYRYLRPQRVWFSAVLVINRVSILAGFGHFGHK